MGTKKRSKAGSARKTTRAKTRGGSRENDVRRVPTQARSRKRFEAILEAAAVAFADEGFDAAKMEGIAAAAGTSIGSVYQFFSNKKSLFRAVAERCLDRSREVFGTLLTADAATRPWTRLIDDSVDAFAGLHDDDPAFRALITNIQLYGEFEAADRGLMAEFAMISAALFGHWAPTITPQRREVIAAVVVQTIAAILLSGAREPRDKFESMLAEVKVMVRRYLEPELRPVEST